MLRFPHLLWAACLGSAVVTLPGCVTGKSIGTSTPPQVNYNPSYDAYYGQPPRSGGQAGVGNRTNGDVGQQGNAHGSIEVNPSAPETYVVQKGDTLWGIAKKYLKTPWYWPELWDKNQRIANPHLIRPGDVLHFGYVNEASGGSGGETKLVPRIRVEQKSTSGESLATLAAFMEWPRIMNDNDIRNAPYILASRDNNSLIPPGETVYVKNMRQPRLGERYAIYHPDKPIHDPETDKLLGHQVTYSGYARLERIDTISTATILDTEGAIKTGDRLLPVERRHGELRAPIQIPKEKIRGQIAAMYDAEYLGASCMIVAINRGKQHGIKPGYTVGVYADGNTVMDKYHSFRGNSRVTPKVTLPPEKVANAIIYSVYDNISYGLITESEREVKNGDKIGNP